MADPAGTGGGAGGAGGGGTGGTGGGGGGAPPGGGAPRGPTGPRGPIDYRATTRIGSDGQPISSDTERLESKLDELIKALLDDLPAKLTELRVADGPSAPGESRQRERANVAQAKFEAVTIDLVEAETELKKGFLNFGRNLAQINEFGLKRAVTALTDTRRQFIAFNAELMSGQAALRSYTRSFKEGMEASSAGLASFIDILKNNFSFAGVTLQETVRTIRENLSEGGQAFAMAGMSSEEYGKALLRARKALEGAGAFEALGFREQNQLLQQVYEQLVGQGIKTQIDSELVRIRAAQQFKLFDQISKNTGKSVQELMKLNKEMAPDIDELVSRGALNPEQANTLRAVMQYLSPDQQQKILKTFQAQGNAAFALRDTIQRDLLSGEMHMAQAIYDAVTRGMTDPKAIARVGADIARSNRASLNPLVSYATIGSERLFQAQNKLAEVTAASDREGPNRMAERVARSIEAFFKNDMPIFKAMADLASAISGLVASGILVAHSMSMRAHTAAMLAASKVPFGAMVRNLFTPQAAAVLGGAGLIFVGLAGALKAAYDFINVTSEQLLERTKQGFGELASMMGKFGELFGKFATGALAIAGGIGLIMGGPIALTVAGIVAAGALILDHFTDGAVFKLFGDMVAGITDYLSGLMESIKGFAARINAESLAAGDGFGAWMGRWYRGLRDAIWEAVKSMLGGMGRSIVNMVTGSPASAAAPAAPTTAPTMGPVAASMELGKLRRDLDALQRTRQTDERDERIRVLLEQMVELNKVQAAYQARITRNTRDQKEGGWE
jgi:hypothetical protein